MKKFGVLLVVLLFATGMTYAQERGGGQRPSSGNHGKSEMRGNRPQMDPEQMIQRETKQLVDELKLNKDQEQKVLAINKKYMEKRKAERAKISDASDADREKMREKMRETMKAEMEAKTKEIKAVLTAEQVKKYDEMMKKRQEMMKNRQGRMGGPGGPGGQQ